VSPLRVLLIGDYPPPHGGVSVHVKQLHEQLRESGVQTQVLDIGKGRRLAPDVRSVRTLGQYASALAAFTAKGWLVHLHTSGNNTKAWWVAGAAGAPGVLGAAPRVITLHSGLLPKFLAGSARRRALARAALAGYAKIVAVSQPVREAVLECGVSASKVVVHPAFCASRVRPGVAPRGLEAALARRSPLIAFAHHPSSVYGSALMLEALKLATERFPRIGLAVFGPGTRTEAFAADARRLGVEAAIEDFGELEHAEAMGLLARCGAFVRPTSADGDAVSVREALALGVPCVASDVCPRPEGTVVFRSGDAEDLVRKLELALASPPARVEGPDAGAMLLSVYRELAA
jgi:glycogen synthase